MTANVFFGGMRGTVWVNIFQTMLFLCFGAVAVAVISHACPAASGITFRRSPPTPRPATWSPASGCRERYFWSYTLIPLSSIMFPHMAIMCFAARRVTAFKRTVVLYPLAILVIWLPCVFLGVLGSQLEPGLKNPDGILLHLLTDHAPVWLAGILGAGIISAVMGSDTHQVLAVSTMFTKDVFAHYGGQAKYGERGSVHFARGFIVVVTLDRLFRRAHHPGEHLRDGGAVRLLRVRRHGAGDDRRPVLEAQHQIWRAGLDPLGRRLAAADVVPANHLRRHRRPGRASLRY